MTAAYGIVRDVRFALQSLRRSPGFTLIAIVTLALGVGANTSAFGILNALLLRPLPYSDSGRLERIYRASAQNARGGVSPADYLDLRTQTSAYGEIGAYGVSEMTLSTPGEPAEMASGLRISANLFSTLGAEPFLGRSFRPIEELLGNHRVLVISHRFWQKRFGGESRIIGRTVRLDGEPCEIVGVLPATLNDWRHLGAFDLFRPLGFTAQERSDRSSTWLRLVGRRSPTLSRSQAQELIAGFGRRLAADFPAASAGTAWRTVPIYDSVIPENAKGIVGMLIGLSGFVLLIACSNLANLLLARTVARARELAVRAALGASRLRLIRPLFLESLLLASVGGVCAVQVAIWTQDWLNAFAERERGEPLIFVLDWRVLGWALGAGLCTAVAFGVAPALFALRLDPNDTLKSGSRGTTGDRGHQRFRRFLIAGQFALAMVLLGGAGLFGRGLHEWNNRGFGWESKDLVTGSMLLPATKYAARADITEFQRLVLERLEALPGVAAASLSYSTPFFGLGESRKYVVAGREPPRPGQEPAAMVNGVSARYFATIGTRVLSGRAFEARDTLTSAKVFIVNQAMARGLFGDDDPLGRRIAQADGKAYDWGEIVGVVADTESVASDRLAQPYQVYQPLAQEPRGLNEIEVRTAGVAPSAVIEGVRAAMMALDPDLPVRELQPAETTIRRARKYQSIIGRLLSLLAGLGLGLASLGVYGVVARAVAQRTGEFGIRLALGARATDITRLVLASGAKLALIGCAVGLLGAFGVTRLVAAAFPGLPTSGVPVLAGATLVLVAIAQLACYVPARKASRINPTEALRTE
jgi:putative ABC transport system permease protein